MIVFTKDGSFSSRVTVITESNCCYAISTAKEGIFKGLSTMVYECSAEPFVTKRGVAKVVYSKFVSRNDRLGLHDNFAEYLNVAIGDGLDISTAIRTFVLPLKEKGVITDFINVA